MSDTPPIRSILRQHQAPNDARRLPPELTGHLYREPHLDIERSEQTLEIGDPGLDLDHEQDRIDGMKCEEIDPPTVAIDIEADFGADEPTVTLETSLPELGEGGVVGIEQPVELSAVPTEVEPERYAKRREDAAQKSQADATEAAVLDRRDDRVTEIGLCGKVRLSPAEAMSQRANDLTDPDVIHQSIIVMSAYRRLSSRLPGGDG